MAAEREMKLSLIFFAFLALSVPATSSSHHLTSMNADGFHGLRHRDLDRYLAQYHYKLWEVLANHGVQVWHS